MFLFVFKNFVLALSLGAQTIQVVAKYILVQHCFIFFFKTQSLLTEKL